MAGCVRVSAVPVAMLALLWVTVLFSMQAQADSGVEVEGPNGVRCVPFKALFSSRIIRSSIDGGKKLRMLRGDAGFRNIEHLMRAHHNCLLKTDRIRFKKSDPNGTPDSGRFRASPIEALLVETRPIHILKQHLNKIQQASHGTATHPQSTSLPGQGLKSQPIQLEPIEVEGINDSERAEMLPNNDWFDAFDVGANDEQK